jgi:hypothetical protein
MKKTELTPSVKAWIKAQRKESRKLFREAEDSRDAHSYTDIDALEQSAYNLGVLETLDKLEQCLK